MEKSFASRIITLIGLAALLLPCSYAQSIWDQYIELQNEARANVDANLQPLQWSDELAGQASLTLRGAFLAICRLNFLQSVDGLTVQVGGLDLAPSNAVASWVSLKGSYDYRTNTCSALTCAPYTQVVTRDTASVGCTEALCANNASLAAVACKYDVAAQPGVRRY